MESMQLTARLMIQENMPHMTAFSALPDAPVLPVRDRRRRVRRTLDALGRRRVSTFRRRPAVRRHPVAT